MTLVSPILQFNDRNFKHEVLEWPSPVVVVFEADWSGSAHIMAPILEELAKHYQNKVKFGRINFETDPIVAREYGVQSAVVIAIFSQGHMVQRFSGAVSRSELERSIHELSIDLRFHGEKKCLE